MEEFPGYAVTALPERLDVHAEPDGPVIHTLDNPQPSGAPLTFLLDEEQGHWLRVLLPVAPNASTGWVRADQVDVQGVPYRLEVTLGTHELHLYQFDTLEAVYPIGVGKGDTPTPAGTFYLKELLRPPDPDGVYGPYAYGLSGFSTTLESFAGTDPVIGLHGTDQPSSVGRDVSNGCIRLRNADIAALAGLLPLGTPVTILG